MSKMGEGVSGGGLVVGIEKWKREKSVEKRVQGEGEGKGGGQRRQGASVELPFALYGIKSI